MIHVWKEHQVKHPETTGIVQAGIDKLGTYQEHADLNLTYVAAMSKFHFLFSSQLKCLTIILVFNPEMRLHYFVEYKLYRYQWAKDIFICTVCEYSIMHCLIPFFYNMLDKGLFRNAVRLRLGQVGEILALSELLITVGHCLSHHKSTIKIDYLTIM